MAASWKRWDASSIHSPAQWVKDPAWSLLQSTLRLWLRFDLWPGKLHMPRGGPKKIDKYINKEQDKEQREPEVGSRFIFKFYLFIYLFIAF